MKASAFRRRRCSSRSSASRGFAVVDAASSAAVAFLLLGAGSGAGPRSASAFSPAIRSLRTTNALSDACSETYRRIPSRRRVASSSPPDVSHSSLSDSEPEGAARDGAGKESRPPQPSKVFEPEVVDDSPVISSKEDRRRSKERKSGSRRMELSCCNRDSCATELREVVVGAHNSMVFTGPATGQVVYGWTEAEESTATTEPNGKSEDDAKAASPPTVLLLIKRDDDELMGVAAEAVRELSNNPRGVRILLDAEQAAKLRHNHGVCDKNVGLFDPALLPAHPIYDFDTNSGSANGEDDSGIPDLVVTLGGDGLLMYASSLFPGPCPPILCVAGGSLGFLTPFSKDEMVVAIESALGLRDGPDFIAGTCSDLASPETNGAAGDLVINGDDDVDLMPQVCLSMRMRLECTIVDADGVARDEFCVLNEVTIDRGSSPYLANLECFCDGTHLTTIQADGVIFATPTGSTAYSMAAGGSVIHPAVPAILVTPICPHVLSFRPMVLPDHVVLRCFVPDDARSSACVSFDGKERLKLRKGESIQICMSHYPVPTINRVDHSSDWLGSLKRNFNFNTRVRQNPL